MVFQRVANPSVLLIGGLEVRILPSPQTHLKESWSSLRFVYTGESK